MKKNRRRKMSEKKGFKRIAVISDVHYNYEYNEDYDKFSETKRAINQIMEGSPDAIFVLGDFFDYRRTDSGGSLSIEQGDMRRNPLVKIIDDTNIPWFIILGNHEKSENLKTFEILCKNLTFLYSKPDTKPRKLGENSNNPVEVDSMIVWGSMIQERGNRTKDKDIILKQYCKTARSITTGKKKILLTHLNMIQTKGLGLEDKILRDLNESFDIILNGHEHSWTKSGISNYSKIIQIPALLPWQVKKGIGFIQKFEFQDGRLKNTSKLRFPNGYVILTLSTLDLNYLPFHSSMPHIQIHYNVTEKDSEQIENDWLEISEEILERFIVKHDIKRIIIKPVIEGTLKNIVFYHINSILKGVNLKFDKIYISPIAPGDSFKKDKIIVESEMEHTELKWESILSNFIKNSDNLITKLEEENIHFTSKNIKILLERLKNNEKVLIKGNTLYSTAGSFISSFLDILNDEFNTSIKKTEIESILSIASTGGK